MAENMFDGFDHTQYKDEVEERWGKKAYADSDRWWRGMSADEKTAWQQRVADLGRDWIAAAESGVAPDSAEAQALAKRHVEWLTGIPGTPACGARRRRQGVRHRPRRDVRRRRALRRELRDERRRHGRRGVRPRRAARLRGGEPVVPQTSGCRARRTSGRGIRHLARRLARRPQAAQRGPRSRTSARAASRAPRDRSDRRRRRAPSCEATSSGAGRSRSSGERRACGVEDDRRRPPAPCPTGSRRARRRTGCRRRPRSMLSTLPDAIDEPLRIGVALPGERQHRPARRAASGQESASAPNPREIARTAIASRAHPLIRNPRPQAPRRRGCRSRKPPSRRRRRARRAAGCRRRRRRRRGARPRAATRSRAGRPPHPTRPRRPRRARRRSRRGRAAPTRRTASARSGFIRRQKPSRCGGEAPAASTGAGTPTHTASDVVARRRRPLAARRRRPTATAARRSVGRVVSRRRVSVCVAGEDLAAQVRDDRGEDVGTAGVDAHDRPRHPLAARIAARAGPCW